MTNLEGRVLRRRRAVAPPPQVRTELEVLNALAGRLGHGRGFPTDPEQVFAELAAASRGGPADYSGISYDRLDAGEALHWPCPAAEAGATPHPGTPRLFLGRFATPDGRARMVPVDHVPVADDLRPDAPVYLVTGRVLEHYQSGAQTRRVPELLAASREAYVQIHPRLAAAVGVEDGDLVRVTSARGEAVAPARVSPDTRPDTVFMPFHFAGPASANLVTNPATDPVSGMPELKVCAVSVAPAEGVPS